MTIAGTLSYFLITSSADGISIREMTKEMVLAELAEDVDYKPECRLINRLGPDIPGDSDPNYWGDSAVLIKGEIVMPRAVQVVTEHELD